MDIFSWFQEEKLLKKFKGLHKAAERIAGDLAAQIAAEKLTVEVLQTIREEAAATRVTLAVLLDLAKEHETKLSRTITQELEQIELMTSSKRRYVEYVDQVNDAATLSANAGDYFLASPDAAAKLLASFNPKVLKTALDILADNEDWQTLAVLYDTAKDKLDNK